MIDQPYSQQQSRRPGAASIAFRLGKRAIKRWAWGILGPVIVPALLIMVGALFVLFTLGFITSAGTSPDLRRDMSAYKAIASNVNPPDVEEGQKLTWGILKASEFILGEGKGAQALAERLAPRVTYRTYSTTITKTAADGTKTTETHSFRLVSEVRTYNTVYSYDYLFADGEGQVIPKRLNAGRLVDRAILYDALTWYAGTEIDPMTANLVEQTAVSFDTGEPSWGWLQGSGEALTGETALFPVAGVITSGFGYRIHPITGALEDHPGVDIAAQEGTPIPSVSEGEVVLAGNNGGYGLCVIVAHKGFQSVYGHASKLLVTVGQTVRSGERIAEVGDTGVSTGPHLHFEVRQNGSPVDPTPWMQ